MRYQSGPIWPTKARRAHHRRRNKARRGGEGLIGPAAIGDENVQRYIIRELLRDQGIAPAPPKGSAPMIGIASLTEHHGLAYVQLGERAHRELVRWNSRGWHCTRCGDQNGPECSHAAVVPRSDELRSAREARGLNNTKRRQAARVKKETA